MFIMVPLMSHHMYKLKNTSLKIDFVKSKKKLMLFSRIVHTIFLQLHKMINRYLNNVILTRVHHGLYLVVYFIYSWSLAILYFQCSKIFNCSIMREFFLFFIFIKFGNDDKAIKMNQIANDQNYTFN